jgi:hypothetical protein
VRSLFLEILHAFWVAIVPVSATLIAWGVTSRSQSKVTRAEELGRAVMPPMAAHNRNPKAPEELRFGLIQKSIWRI